MIVFQEQEHDFTGTTYVAVSRNYRWWVNIDHDRNCAAEIQVCRLFTTLDGDRKVGKHVYSNLPESTTTNILAPKLVAKMESLSLEHHVRNGRKGDYREYKKRFRHGGLGRTANTVNGVGGQSSPFKIDTGIRRPAGMYKRDSKYAIELEYGSESKKSEPGFYSQPKSGRGGHRFC